MHLLTAHINGQPQGVLVATAAGWQCRTAHSTRPLVTLADCDDEATMLKALAPSSPNHALPDFGAARVYPSVFQP